MPTSKKFLPYTGDNGKLEVLGSTATSVKRNSGLNSFDESNICSDSMSSVMKHRNDSHWFFDHSDDITDVEFEPRRWSKDHESKLEWDKKDDELLDFLLQDDFQYGNTDVEFEPGHWGKDHEPKLKWDKKDDDLLDFLLQDDFQCGEAMPGLESISSFEDPTLRLTEMCSLVDKHSNSMESFSFDDKDFFCEETKLFDPTQVSIASTESGSDVQIEQDLESPVEDASCDGISALTMPLSCCQEQSVIAEEKACWYRAKIASFFAPAKKFIARTEELCIRPEGMVDIPVPLLIHVPRQDLTRRFIVVDVPDSLLVQVPQQKVARRLLVMRQGMATQDQLEHLSSKSRHDQCTSMASF